ncbi:MAG: ATP phosphoribosyltransferase [Deltaproteobacteria bacterium]|nr:ATP phosphoribosyltransferase [Deltaproteobacteria bacterium]
MIRLALPKGRNLATARAAFRAAGMPLEVLDDGQRQLRLVSPEEGLEILLLKDWDVPLYVQYGIADCGVVGSDVLEETAGDLLVPVRFREGRSRLSLIGRPGSLPKEGSQIRLATKYPRIARNVLRERPWGAEILKLHGSIELAPLLDLAELALDIVQTGRTLKENHLQELEVIRQVAACLVVNRASFQRLRGDFNRLFQSLEKAEVVT